MILCIIALIILGTLMVLINTGKLDQLKAMFGKSSARRDDRYRDDYYEVNEWDEYRRDYEQRRRDEYRRDRNRD